VAQRQNLRVLVAEKQYLIALEVERILVESLGCTTAICGPALETALDAAQYDIVILDTSASTERNLQRAKLVEDNGAAVIFLSSYELVDAEYQALKNFPIVGKPFDDDQIVEAVLAVERSIYPAA